MTKKIKVKARDGLVFPVENSPRREIGQEPLEVDDSMYYQRALADGDLILVPDVKTKVTKQTQKTTEQSNG